VAAKRALHTVLPVDRKAAYQGMHIGVFVGQLQALRRHDSGGGLFKLVISVVHGAGLSKKKRIRQTQAALNG